MSNTETIQIKPPNFGLAEFKIKGIAPLVINKFSQKAREEMRAKQELGAQAKKGAKKEPKDFDLCYQQARHISRDGWDGIAAAAFRKAMIGACRLVGFKMTHAKLALFVEADGFDADEGTPLIRITDGEPRQLEMAVRIQNTSDIRVRPMWEEWGATLRLRFDADMFSLTDVTNLLMRAGLQVGVGEGRPGSQSGGMGWGLFVIEEEEGQ